MQAANLLKSDTLKLYHISQGDFTLQDYSKKELTAQIFVNGFEDIENVEVSPADILESALGFGFIDSFYDPTETNPDYLVDEESIGRTSFKEWWEFLDPQNTEQLLESAIAGKVDHDLKRIYRELTGKYAPELQAA